MLVQLGVELGRREWEKIRERGERRYCRYVFRSLLFARTIEFRIRKKIMTKEDRVWLKD